MIHSLVVIQGTAVLNLVDVQSNLVTRDGPVLNPWVLISTCSIAQQIYRHAYR